MASKPKKTTTAKTKKKPAAEEAVDVFDVLFEKIDRVEALVGANSGLAASTAELLARHAVVVDDLVDVIRRLLKTIEDAQLGSAAREARIMPLAQALLQHIAPTLGTKIEVTPEVEQPPETPEPSTLAPVSVALPNEALDAPDKALDAPDKALDALDALGMG